MKNDTTLAIRLPAELVKRVRMAAARDGRSASNFVRNVLRRALDEAEQ